MVEQVPRLGFLIGGVQKGGTSALAAYLGAHPDVALPAGKEAHVFDCPDYGEDWSRQQVDERFAAHFPNWGERMLHGDATPITVFHETFVRRVARYNPAMRWIVLLRDPVARAISHYHMERNRGLEPLPLLRAVLAEPARLRGHGDDFTADSPLRKHSYVERGRYARQLDALLRWFPRDQVLLLRSRDLGEDPAGSTRRALAFLGLPWYREPPRFERVFAGRYRALSPLSPSRLLLRLRLRGERAALLARHGIDLGGGGAGG